MRKDVVSLSFVTIDADAGHDAGGNADACTCTDAGAGAGDGAITGTGADIHAASGTIPDLMLALALLLDAPHV